MPRRKACKQVFNGCLGPESIRNPGSNEWEHWLINEVTFPFIAFRKGIEVAEKSTSSVWRAPKASSLDASSLLLPAVSLCSAKNWTMSLIRVENKYAEGPIFLGVKGCLRAKMENDM